MKDVKVREIMSTAVHHVSPSLRLVDLESQLSSQRISGAPVIERGKVVGIVSRSDIEQALSQERVKTAAAATYYQQTDLAGEQAAAGPVDPSGPALESLRKSTVRDVMTREVISVEGDDSVVEAARWMKRRRIHRVLVIEEGRLLGIVSSFDIVCLLADGDGG
jgi:CBS domain-containing protein